MNGDASIAGTLTVTSLWVSSGLTVQNGGFTQTGSPFIVASDKRIKRDIVPISDALHRITKLKGVYFNWRKDKALELSLDHNRHIGLIAQDVLEFVPEAVDNVHGASYLGVDYGSLVSLLIAGFNEFRSIKWSERKITQEFFAQLFERIKSLNNLIDDYDTLQKEQEHLVNETLRLQQEHRELLNESQKINEMMNAIEVNL